MRRRYSVAGRTPNIAMLSVVKPRLTLRRLSSVRTKRPAPTSRSSDSATWSATNDFRRRTCPCPLVTEPASSLSVAAAATREPRNAGSSPNSTAVAKVTTLVNRRIRPSGAVDSESAAGSYGRKRTRPRASQVLRNSPAAPPAVARIMLSTKSCRTSWLRLAPSALRMAISRWRAAARASRSPATFVHAISSTTPTSHCSTTSGRSNVLRSADIPRSAGTSESVARRNRSLVSGNFWKNSPCSSSCLRWS